MSAPAEAILHVPQTVREDTLAYRQKVAKFLADDKSAIALRAYRVPMGVYEQRTAGRFMVRVRIGAGLAMPFQVERLAELSKRYGNGILHVTTRQDIQIHEVSIEETSDVMEGLLEVGLSPRGGGGNTVRNVTACPRAGVCPKEAFDVAPYAIATAEYLLADRSSFNLPRKYKIVFSGCPEDCAYASVGDLGFFAHQNDGVEGFSVYAGGGLGPNPAVGVTIEDFVEAGEVFGVAEAVKRLFDKHGDRTNKHKARLRYVLAGVGVDEFIRLYRQERRELQSSGLPYEAPEIRDIASRYAVSEAPEADVQTRLHVLSEKTLGRVTIQLRLTNGDIPAEDLVKVGRLATKYGQGLIRTTQLQNLFISGVGQQDVGKIESELKDLSIDVFGGAGPKVIACAGAATCKLGLCLSRGLADAITQEFSKDNVGPKASETVIRISGCPNSCGHHYISKIGLQGWAKRINGRLMPFYAVLTGGRTVEGRAHLAEAVGSVPAKQIPDLLLEALSDGVEAWQVKDLIAKYSDLGEGPLVEDYYRDFGSDEPFSLAGRGPGECGAGVMDVIRFDIDEAKDAVKATPATSENVYKAIVAASRALLLTFGVEPKNDREIFGAFSKHLIEPGWVDGRSGPLLDAAIDWRMGDRESLVDLLGHAERLMERVEKLFVSLNASLKFTVEPMAQKDAPPANEAGAQTVNLRGVACPMNFVKAKLALEQVAVGDVLDILLDDGEPARNAPASFAEQGQEVLEITNMGGHFSVKVRRKK
jgi:sulfite reductase (ferredoxin)